jgi:hypothetical protein
MIVGFCADTLGAMSTSFREHGAVYGYSPSRSKIFTADDLPKLTVDSGFEAPTILLKWINKVVSEIISDADTIKRVANQSDRAGYIIIWAVGILKGFIKLDHAIQRKDIGLLKELLWYENKKYRGFFQESTGVDLGKTDKSMRLAIDKWGA